MTKGKPASTWFGPTEEPNSERWHGDLLALDPSVNSPGVSLFRHGRLVACARVQIPHMPECGDKLADCVPHCIHVMAPAARWLRVANEITAWWMDQRDGHDHVIRTVIYELPQIYSEKERKSKGDPNKLLGLVGVGQSFATLVSSYNVAKGARPPELLSPKPAEWTGQLPKTIKGKIPKAAWTSPRGLRIKTRLKPAELGVTIEQHDIIDSIGLGLFALGRYERERVFPGAV